MRFVSSWPFRCWSCGWFLSRVQAIGNEAEGVKKVTGVCKRHGRVESRRPWAYEDLGAPSVEMVLG